LALNFLMSSMQRSSYYWLCQSLGWFLYGTVGTSVQFAYSQPDIRVAMLAYSGSAILFLFTDGMRSYAKRHRWERLGFLQLGLRVLLATFLMAIVSQSLVSVLMLWVLKVATVEQYSFFALGLYVFQTMVILLLWSTIYFSFQFFRNYKREEVERWRLQAAVKDAELTALKAQINPHFIFNCLNNIRALILEDTEKAREAITRLSELLRHSIRLDQAETVTLEHELGVVCDYLELEKIQMEERLQYRMDVDEGIGSCKVPTMIVQLLVENAVKHGIAPRPEGGEVCIRILNSQGRLDFEVINSGHLGKGKSRGTGIGLRNARERLRLLYGEASQLILENQSNDTVSARFSIPANS